MTHAFLDDLAAEHEELDAVLAGLDEAGWDRDAPAVGFDVPNEVYHLGLSEELASLAATDRGAFGARLLAISGAVDVAERQFAETARVMHPGELLGALRRRVDDTALRVDGPMAYERLPIAHAFAGPPTDGPAPGGSR